MSCRMLGVTRLQNSRPVRMAPEEYSVRFWFWREGVAAACSQYTVHSCANMKAWNREHMWSTEVCGGRERERHIEARRGSANQR